MNESCKNEKYGLSTATFCFDQYRELEKLISRETFNIENRVRKLNSNSIPGKGEVNIGWFELGNRLNVKITKLFEEDFDMMGNFLKTT